MKGPFKCEPCRDERWVCENHPDWPAHNGLCCGGAGMPCLACNQTPEGVWPAMAPGHVTLWSIWTDGETVN